jgi:dTMP kinase
MADHDRSVTHGRLLAFEGLDGCGKSTQVTKLAGALRSAGVDVVTTREPTDGPTGRRIREMARSGKTIPAEQELQWFIEDRREHVAQVIRPALERGQVVVTDRYFLSTVAYQGARGLSVERILADSVAEFPLPDLVILLEVDPAEGLARVEGRGGEREPVFEKREFLEAVAANFRALELPYIVRIDGGRTEDAVAEDVSACVRERLDLF